MRRSTRRSDRVRSFAVWALGEAGDPRAVPALIPRAADAHPARTVTQPVGAGSHLRPNLWSSPGPGPARHNPAAPDRRAGRSARRRAPDGGRSPGPPGRSGGHPRPGRSLAGRRSARPRERRPGAGPHRSQRRAGRAAGRDTGCGRLGADLRGARPGHHAGRRRPIPPNFAALAALLADTREPIEGERVCDVAADALQALGTPEALAALDRWRRGRVRPGLLRRFWPFRRG